MKKRTEKCRSSRFSKRKRESVSSARGKRKPRGGNNNNFYSSSSSIKFQQLRLTSGTSKLLLLKTNRLRHLVKQALLVKVRVINSKWSLISCRIHFERKIRSKETKRPQQARVQTSTDHQVDKKRKRGPLRLQSQVVYLQQLHHSSQARQHPRDRNLTKVRKKMMTVIIAKQTGK